jgi:hypothetical protein
MAKAELETAQFQYDQEIKKARISEKNGDFHSAIRHAVNAWEYVEGMMKFEKRWECAEFDSVPCIDIVLRYAPLILDGQALCQLSDLLRKRKSIDKIANDDLAARVAEAQALLRQVHQLWNLVERQPLVRQDMLRQILGGNQDTWRGIAEQWESMGLIHRIKHSGSYMLKFATELSERWRAKCPSCGAIAVGAKRAFLDSQECPRCRAASYFVLQNHIVGSLVETNSC